MSWFRVDDRLHGHPKAHAAGNAALGLWTRIGSWISDHLTDGFVPAAVVRQYGTRRELERLILAGMLEADNHPVYGAGYYLHDYLDWNRSRNQVLADRAKTAERQRSSRARRGTDGQTELPLEDGARHGVTHTTPTRPDPTRPVVVTSVDRQTDIRAADRGPSSVAQIITAAATGLAAVAGRDGDLRYLNGIRRNLEAERLEEITTMLEHQPPLDVVASIVGSKVHARAALATVTRNGDHP